MARRFAGDRLLIATHNAGKLVEFQELLAPLGIQVVGGAGAGLVEPEETGATFIANAVLKAQAAVQATGLPALADDSGIAVDGLDGAPGIYSARWGGPGRDFQMAMARVHRELAERHGSFTAAPKEAAFVCVLCLAWPDGHHELFEGRVDGTLAPEPRGTGGHGYDPIFIPEGQTQTFGQLPPAAKQTISHRARATSLLLAGCFPIGSSR